jgi:hypothetical protein
MVTLEELAIKVIETVDAAGVSYMTAGANVRP